MNIRIDGRTEEYYSSKKKRHYFSLFFPLVEEIKVRLYGSYFLRQDTSKSRQIHKSDIIGKALLRNLPGLYGINDMQELNSLFITLAYNTGNEVFL